MKRVSMGMKVLIVSSSFLVVMIITASLFAVMHKSDNEDVFIHISFDDTITVFEDLNKNTYESIFDNEFLSYLKNLHDEYGAVFSLYCYYENSDFNLSQVTDKFANEFSHNADWLKFGYHSTNDKEKMSDLNPSDAVLRYKTAIRELIRITGGKSSLDTISRFHYYSGSEEALVLISKTEGGSTGFLTADDERNSYYLNNDENLYIDTHDFFKDNENGIYFVSTDLRLEKTLNPYYSLMKIAADEKQNKCIEVFTHEWQYGRLMKLKLWATCFFAYKEGYSWDYPMYRYIN